jgi:hypothetical protein
MKTLLVIIFLHLSFDLLAQIVPRNDWPVNIQNKFLSFKDQNLDSILIYYDWLGPWNDLADSCNGVSSIFIIWKENNKYSAKQLSCSSLDSKEIHISNIPFKYFLGNIHNVILKVKFLNQFDEPYLLSTDQYIEYLILMTKTDNIVLILSEEEKSFDLEKYPWIKSYDEVIKVIKRELKIKNGP